MNYFYSPPGGWPPNHHHRPPVDDWMPPPFWEPKLDRLPLSPLGGLLFIPPPPGADPRSLSVEEQEEAHRRVVRRMLGMWARAVQADAHSYWQAAVRANWMDWAIDKIEEWSPDERDLPPALEQVWVRGYKLIMSTYQMERWLQAHRRLNGEQEQPKRYEDLRNALEHLDEANFTELSAVRPPSDTGKRGKWAIDELPGRQVFLGFHPVSTEDAFGIVNLAEVTKRAREYAYVDSNDLAEHFGTPGTPRITSGNSRPQFGRSEPLSAPEASRSPRRWVGMRICSCAWSPPACLDRG
jgi:hypothetical protein